MCSNVADCKRKCKVYWQSASAKYKKQSASQSTITDSWVEYQKKVSAEDQYAVLLRSANTEYQFEELLQNENGQNQYWVQVMSSIT